MIFIGGISMGKKELEFFKTMVCKKCGQYTNLTVFMTYTYFSFFFIPLFKWGKKYYAVSRCCGTVFSLDPEIGKAIEQGENVTLSEEDLNPTGYEENGTAHCADCGYLLENDFAYCPKCGRKLF